MDLGTDFLSQSTLAAGFLPPDDALGHLPFARALLERVVTLGPGAVVAIQGDWGRGKSDVLSRTFLLARDRREDIAATLWLNPWQYGSPDLLSPLVLALLACIPQETRASVVLRTAAKSIVRAGISFGCKTLQMTMPSALTEPLEKVALDVVEAFTADHSSGTDNDPVAAMAIRFQQLVHAVAGDKLVLICIDDIDRCLPDRQVALLEALRFLTSSGARACFLIGLDPTLARAAIHMRYGSQEFSADRYLDKLFHLRCTLPTLATSELEALVSRSRNASPNGSLDSAAVANFPKIASTIFALVGLRNPRLLQRILTRVLLSTSGPDGVRPRDDNDLYILLSWFCIAELFPDFRVAIQAARQTDIAASLLAQATKSANGGLSAALLYLSDTRKIPHAKIAEAIMTFDESLRRRGL